MFFNHTIITSRFTGLVSLAGELCVMIKNLTCKHTQALYEGKSPKKFKVFSNAGRT